MAWRGIKDWEAGRVVTETDLDQYISENTEFLYNRGPNAGAAVEAITSGGALGTSVLTPTAITGLNPLSLTTNGGDILFMATFGALRGSSYILSVQIDSQPIVTLIASPSYSAPTYPATIIHVFRGVSAGSHTIQLLHHYRGGTLSSNIQPPLYTYGYELPQST